MKSDDNRQEWRCVCCPRLFFDLSHNSRYNDIDVALRTSPIRILLSLTIFLFAQVDSNLSGQSAPDMSSHHKRIRVKVRNGATGYPIWFASPYVFLGKAVAADLEKSYRRTHRWSDAQVDVTGVSPKETKVWIDFIDRDCRYPENNKAYRTFDFAGNTLNESPAYDIDKILLTGIVTPNFCSQKTQSPEPGVLVIYVIPEKFKDIWNS